MKKISQNNRQEIIARAKLRMGCQPTARISIADLPAKLREHRKYSRRPTVLAFARRAPILLRIEQRHQEIDLSGKGQWGGHNVSAVRHIATLRNQLADISLVTRQARQADTMTTEERAIRRAKNDPKFRANFLRGLTREVKALHVSPASTLAGITAAADTRRRRNQRIAAIVAIRVRLGVTTPTPEIPAITTGILIPITVELARRAGASINMSGKDATLRPTRASSWGRHTEHVPARKRGGKWIGFERAEHSNYIRSFAIISEDATTLHYALHTTEHTITLPTGYRWVADANGIAAIHGAADYHPSAAELIARDASAKIVAKIAECAARRAEMRARTAAEAAEVEGVMVCLADALRAGNCRAGSESFCARHQLDPRRHYSAPELISIANGDASRVRLAITAARIRTAREDAQGYALLADHTA